MTKKQALIDTVIIWQYLADNPSAYSPRVAKADATAQAFTKAKDYFNNCPCCEFLSIRNTSCVKQRCIINWSESVRGSSCIMFTCENNDSPYRHWILADTNKEKTKYATKIVELAEAALSNLAITNN